MVDILRGYGYNGYVVKVVELPHTTWAFKYAVVMFTYAVMFTVESNPVQRQLAIKQWPGGMDMCPTDAIVRHRPATH